MRDLHQALDDIAEIRSRIAAGSMFRGLGPLTIAGTGVLALALGAAQTVWPAALASDPTRYLLVWIAAALLAGVAVAIEMVDRSRRHHGAMATAMILRVIEQFLPAAAAGFAASVALLRYAPDSLWLVPGLWQLFMAVGVFASVRLLPWGLSFVAAWYFLAGATVLIAASETRDLAPWMMAAPFAVGQLGMGLALHLASRRADD